ncbi:MAG: hypothetical protein A07HR67_02783 [uncultured archaeon A07HR67]|jgi:Predicted PP-loop superfamily ATPase|nr:MAG: hypothetical protein A07HR67_02783 [uncultured archaeon A07HR67]
MNDADQATDPFDDINLVPNKTEKLLNERQYVDYRSEREHEANIATIEHRVAVLQAERAALEELESALDQKRGELELLSGFVEWSKTEIEERGLELGVPHDMPWSCYRGEEPAFGTCDACAFQFEAFRNAGSRDPIAYAERPEFS